MSIITKGYGVQNESIITQGYGRKIEQIVIEVVEELIKRKVGSSGTKRRQIFIDEEKYQEFTIFASLTSVNDKDLSIPISNEIKKRIEESDIKIKVKNIQIETRGKDIEVKVSMKSNISSKKSVKVRAKKKD
jgi:citrate lyase gamma subunit